MITLKKEEVDVFVKNETRFAECMKRIVFDLKSEQLGIMTKITSEGLKKDQEWGSFKKNKLFNCFLLGLDICFRLFSRLKEHQPSLTCSCRNAFSVLCLECWKAKTTLGFRLEPIATLTTGFFPRERLLAGKCCAWATHFRERSCPSEISPLSSERHRAFKMLKKSLIFWFSTRKTRLTRSLPNKYWEAISKCGESS